MHDQRRIAYFSMEIAMGADIPTYSGGLGVLAGDTIRSAADLKIPMVAVTLLYRKGYFYQKLDDSGWQHEQPVQWVIEDFLEELDVRTSVTLSGRTVQLRCWQRQVHGCGGHVVPVYFLDADLPENSEQDRKLTDSLYGGDRHYRLCQEVILGIGGRRMLRALGHEDIERFHMNEGHASLLAVELLDERIRHAGRSGVTTEDLEAVRTQCVFTTHTPVPAGHDKFPLEMVREVLGGDTIIEKLEFCHWEGALNMTYLALNLSNFVNGVAKKHAEVSSNLFARYTVESITNGVHAATWTSVPFRDLFDRFIPGWQSDNLSLRYAESIPKLEIWAAHRSAKERLMHFVNRQYNAGLDIDAFTLCFARRAAAYKRADLFFHDLDRLRHIARHIGPLQVIYAGKAHPQDNTGKELIKRICGFRDELREDIKVIYLRNYDTDLGALLTGGVDLWLNTPRPPLEASGTSGMKAALNGVPSLSILDGWWIEGCIEGVTGWAIESNEQNGSTQEEYHSDAASLYDKLENVILPLFYHRRERFIEVMRHSIAINGSFFNTARMMHEYVLKAYFL